MVRALLAGSKTQTRRVLRAKAGMTIADATVDAGPACGGIGRRLELPVDKLKFPYAVGDRLYVREAWKTSSQHDSFAPRDLLGTAPVYFTADDRLWPVAKYRQAMHMPRWASRLTLIVTQVLVQRLQEISEADAIAEGCRPIGSEFLIPGQYFYSDASKSRTALSATSAYESLWNGLNEPRGFGWDTNPWVVAVSFTVEHCNIDESSIPKSQETEKAPKAHAGPSVAHITRSIT
ncbi:hypothetical protein [Mesorhizobium sp. M0520]|uniref:hypothetical protein n=1 Tax=Mesorhizobium sp. M0520 TaxID=2956957 RepID=UPI00333526D4